MKTLLAVMTLSFLTTFAIASTNPNQEAHLNTIASYLGKPDFDADFKCGDKASISGSAKVTGIKVQKLELKQEIVCKENDKILRTEVVSSGGAFDNVQVAGTEIGTIFDNIETADLILNKEEYEVDPKEYLFTMLDYLGDTDKFEIESVKFQKVKGPGAEKVDAMIVQLRLDMEEITGPGIFSKVNVKVFISKDLPGVSRVFKTEVSTGKVVFVSTAGGSLEVTEVSRQ